MGGSQTNYTTDNDVFDGWQDGLPSHPATPGGTSSDEVSFVYKFLALVSLLLFFAPIIGLVLAAITVVGAFGSHTWPRTTGMVSLVLASVVNLLFILGLIFVK